MSTRQRLPPILVADLFPEISAHLVTLLRSLSAAEWQLPTSSSRRRVKDVAAHLLDGSLRRLSMQRDRYSDEGTRPRDGESILNFLNRLNDEWDVASRRLSPTVLVHLIEWADGQLAELFAGLDPYGPAIFAVAWAGESESQNWFDVARDYTEKWHHTHQIFVATGRASSITGRRLFRPCIDAFLRALPYTYQDVPADVGAAVGVSVTGDAGGEWTLSHASDGWILGEGRPESAVSRVTLDQETLWRLVTKRRTREEVLAALPGIRIEGDEELGGRLLELVSMMA